MANEAQIHFLTSPGYFLAMAATERLKKYESTIGAHLDKVDLSLDEEIANLKSKIKELQLYTKETEEKQKEFSQKEKTLRTQNESEKRRFEEDYKKKEAREKEREIERKRAEEEMEALENIEQQNLRMRRELDDLLAEIRVLTEEIKGVETTGKKREHRHAMESMELSLQRLQQKKAAQDNAVRRLRKDVSYIESALEKVDNRLLAEVRSRPSDASDLGRKAKIYEDERATAADEFASAIQHLLKEDNGQQMKNRKEKAVSKNTHFFSRILEEDCDFLVQEAHRQVEKSKELEKRNKELQKKLDMLISRYDEMKSTKTDSTTHDFSLENISTIAAKQKLHEKIGRREEKYRGLLDRFQEEATAFTKREQRLETNGLGRLEELKKDLLTATRRENALRGKISRIAERNERLEEELEKQRRNLERTAEEVRRIDADVVAKDDIVVDSVTITTDEEKRRTYLEKKEAELANALEKLEMANKLDEKRLTELKDSLYALNSKIYAGSRKERSEINEETAGLRRELKELKNQQMNISKAVAKLQKELELSVVRRDAAVGKAQAVVPLRTNIRGERRNELDAARRRVEHKRKQLENFLVD